MNRDRIAAYAQVMILALAASVIYSAPYLRQLFKTSLLEAFSLTEAQLGNLSSTYALSCLVCYVPGGWLADRVEARKLVIMRKLRPMRSTEIVAVSRSRCDCSDFFVMSKHRAMHMAANVKIIDACTPARGHATHAPAALP